MDLTETLDRYIMFEYVYVLSARLYDQALNSMKIDANIVYADERMEV